MARMTERRGVRAQKRDGRVRVRDGRVRVGGGRVRVRDGRVRVRDERAQERDVRAQLTAGFEEAARLASAALKETDPMVRAIEMVVTALQGGHQIYFCGNGGSASQAAHLAAELSGRFYYDRPALGALALTENTAALTAIANDYGYEHVFERQLAGLAHSGDVLVALTTSGRSPNVQRAVDLASRLGVRVIGFTGLRGRSFAKSCDVAFVVPAADTARIQEVHLLLGHLLCARVEAELFPPRAVAPSTAASMISPVRRKPVKREAGEKQP
jgi:D-sedoheptulose 7-phosphate isomerase